MGVIRLNGHKGEIGGAPVPCSAMASSIVVDTPKSEIEKRPVALLVR